MYYILPSYSLKVVSPPVTIRPMSLSKPIPLSLLLLLLPFLATLISAERVAIQAGKSFCVFDDLKIGSPWGVQFQSDEHEIKTIVSVMAATISV